MQIFIEEVFKGKPKKVVRLYQPTNYDAFNSDLFHLTDTHAEPVAVNTFMLVFIRPDETDPIYDVCSWSRPIERWRDHNVIKELRELGKQHDT